MIEQPSEIALPALLRSGARYDLALIDGLHTADQTMLDFYFLDRLLQVGGILVFDVNAPAVNKIARYAGTYPNYQLIGTSGRRGTQRRIINLLKQSLSIGLWPARRLFTEALYREFLDISLVYPEMLWNIDFCTMAAFQKTGDYERDTDWYRGM